MGKRYQPRVCEEVVRPSGARTETQLVLLAALVTVVICATAILLRNSSATAKEVPSWQVDAFGDLGAEEMAIFNGLYSAAGEIEFHHQMNGDDWPSVDDLAGDYIPPFVEDVAWQKNGRYSWSRNVIATQDKHIALYIGHPADGKGGGSFLLVMLHDHVKKEGNASATHAPFEIWLHDSPVADTPLMVTDQALINKGWREVKARKGEEETRRTKEEFIQ